MRFAHGTTFKHVPKEYTNPTDYPSIFRIEGTRCFSKYFSIHFKFLRKQKHEKPAAHSTLIMSPDAQFIVENVVSSIYRYSSATAFKRTIKCI